jgi:hypothetical protein
LVVVAFPDAKNVEAVTAKQPGERGFGEIRAVLVIDVPKCRFRQDPAYVRYLKEDDRSALGGSHALHRTKQPPRLRYVFERHLAADEVDRLRYCLLVEESPNHPDVADVLVLPRRHEARVIADRAFATEFPKHRQELALTAPDLEHVLAMEAVARHELLRE